MGGGYGGSRGGPNGAGAEILRNIERLKQEFPTTRGGYFGSRSTSTNRRNIASADPLATARKFFELISRGGQRTTEHKPGVTRVRFPDGSNITYRPVSSSDGSPVVDINLKILQDKIARYQKIHFTEASK